MADETDFVSHGTGTDNCDDTPGGLAVVVADDGANLPLSQEDKLVPLVLGADNAHVRRPGDSDVVAGDDIPAAPAIGPGRGCRQGWTDLPSPAVDLCFH